MDYSQEKLRNSKEVAKKLFSLDYRCEKRNITAELVILGGSGVLLFMETQEDTFRPTRDIDIELIAATDEKLFYASLEDLNIHRVGGVIEVPPQEELKMKENLEELEMDFTNICVYVPNIEMLACCKIFSKREKDLIDLKESSILEKCDKEKLIRMVDDYRNFLLNPSDPDLNIHELVNIFYEKGI